MSAWRAAAVPASGLRIAWTPWDAAIETVATLRWDNEAWTVECALGAHDVQLVLRLGADWRLQQCLLFRDMPTPDLWLGTDGRGRWGEVNGSLRPELAGCELVEVAGSPFHHAVAVRGAAPGLLAVGDETIVRTARVDVETLGVQVRERRYRRTRADAWSWTSATTGREVEVCVDGYGVALDEPGAWRRVSG
jgi:hypothetical protein